jgi:hypothetical protein
MNITSCSAKSNMPPLAAIEDSSQCFHNTHFGCFTTLMNPIILNVIEAVSEHNTSEDFDIFKRATRDATETIEASKKSNTTSG